MLILCYIPQPTPTNAKNAIFLDLFSFRRILRDNALKSIQVLIEQTMPTEKYGKFPKKLTVSRPLQDEGSKRLKMSQQ